MESPDLKERDMPVAGGGGRSAQVRERICLFLSRVRIRLIGENSNF